MHAQGSPRGAACRVPAAALASCWGCRVAGAAMLRCNEQASGLRWRVLQMGTQCGVYTGQWRAAEGQGPMATDQWDGNSGNKQEGARNREARCVPRCEQSKRAGACTINVALVAKGRGGGGRKSWAAGEVRPFTGEGYMPVRLPSRLSGLVSAVCSSVMQSASGRPSLREAQPPGSYMGSGALPSQPAGRVDVLSKRRSALHAASLVPQHGTHWRSWHGCMLKMCMGTLHTCHARPVCHRRHPDGQWCSRACMWGGTAFSRSLRACMAGGQCWQQNARHFRQRVWATACMCVLLLTLANKTCKGRENAHAASARSTCLTCETQDGGPCTQALCALACRQPDWFSCCCRLSQQTGAFQLHCQTICSGH